MQSDVSIMRHFGAIFYDAFLVFSLIFVINLLLVPFYQVEADQQNSQLFFLITLPATYLYFALSWVKGGQTLGMKAWGFRMIKIDHSPLTHKDALIRFIAAIMSLVLPGLLYKFIDPNHRALQDKLSRTILIKN